MLQLIGYPFADIQTLKISTKIDPDHWVKLGRTNTKQKNIVDTAQRNLVPIWIQFIHYDFLLSVFKIKN